MLILPFPKTLNKGFIFGISGYYVVKKKELNIFTVAEHEYRFDDYNIKYSPNMYYILNTSNIVFGTYGRFCLRTVDSNTAVPPIESETVAEFFNGGCSIRIAMFRIAASLTARLIILNVQADWNYGI